MTLTDITTIDRLVDCSALEARCAGPVTAPGDDGWDQARQGWNLAADQRPVAVAEPVNASDVRAIVSFAAEQGLRVAAQGTGHNAAALVDKLDGTILVRTHRMRDVEIDAQARTARVAAGALWADVTVPASEHDLAPLAGSSPDVGVVGYSLGGGISWLARKHGLSANHILSIEIVTADGELRRVDADHDPDLFWALRGGGGNFGVVTALEIRLFEVADLYAGMLVWPWERSAEVMAVWHEWTRTAPDEVTTSFRILQIPPLEDIPEMLRGRQIAVIDGAFLGDEADGAELLAPLRALGPEIDTFTIVPPAALSWLHMDPEEPMPFLGHGAVISELDHEAIDHFVGTAGPGTGSPLMMAEMRHLGGALAEAPADAGAVCTMAGDYLMFAGGAVFDEASGRAIAGGVNALLDAMAPWTADRTYLNFAERPTDPGTIFGETALRRLLQVKAQVDPQDLFRGNHTLSEES
jgi:FAD/FMN-containing dehydrogenase